MQLERSVSHATAVRMALLLYRMTNYLYLLEGMHGIAINLPLYYGCFVFVQYGLLTSCLACGYTHACLHTCFGIWLAAFT